MTTAESPDVLIAGAGPTGMILAHELLRRGVRIRQVDRREGPSHTTRAFTLHARTMEMFEHLGVAPRLEQISLPCPGNVFYFEGVPPEDRPRLDFRTLPSRFAFYYKLNQNDFEQVLRDHLLATYSHVPQYAAEVTDVRLADDGAQVQIQHGETREAEELDVPWVVGCDGAHSRVRESAGISFERAQVGVMAMMDVEITDFPYDDDWVNYFIGRDLFMLVTKLPGRLWRVYLSDPGEMTHDSDAQATFQKVSDRLGIGMRIGDPDWATRWTIPNGIAAEYRADRVLICGDASHVHSPAGGQGMNGCMQDAFNLGWKLANVIDGRSPDRVLDTYGVERRPIGEQVTLGTKATHDIVMAFGKNLDARVALTQTPEWHDAAVALISGLSHNYRDHVSMPDGLSPVDGPAAGERAPDAVLVAEPQRRVFDLLRHPYFTLLLVPGKDPNEATTVTLLASAVTDAFAEQVRPVLIYREDPLGFDIDHAVHDELGRMRAAYQIGPDDAGRIVLVRPDMYVALNAAMTDANTVVPYLRTWLNAVAVTATGEDQQPAMSTKGRST